MELLLLAISCILLAGTTVVLAFKLRALEQTICENRGCNNALKSRLDKHDEYHEKLRKREYLISTNFVGIVKNKKLLDRITRREFRQLIRPSVYTYNAYISSEDYVTDYYGVVEAIRNYDFRFLDDLYYLIDECERDQRILNEYGGKP